MSLDFSDASRLQTRDGREVRIYATDHAGDWPVIGAIRIDDTWEIESWDRKGRSGCVEQSPHDLIPKPTRVTGWVNVVCDGSQLIVCGVFESKMEAQIKATSQCIGQIYIDTEVQT